MVTVLGDEAAGEEGIDEAELPWRREESLSRVVRNRRRRALLEGQEQEI
jgi:hypothetical protein